MPNSLGRSLLRTSEEAIPVPWPSLAKLLRPVPGTLIVVGAAPGAGKSAFSLNWIAKTGAKATLLSLDTDLATQGARLTAITNDIPLEWVMKNEQRWGNWLQEQKLPIRAYDFHTAPERIAEFIEADTEFFGCPPTFLVVDNLSDFTPEGGFEGHRHVVLALRSIARRYRLCVIALHHIKRSDMDYMPTLSSLLYAGEKEAEVVLGIRTHQTYMDIGILKNRMGEADAHGQLYVRLHYLKSHQHVTELPGAQTAGLRLV